MSDREAFEKWAAEIDLGDNLVFDTSSGCVGVKDMAWEAWQVAQAQAGGGEAVTVEDIVLVTGTVLFSAGSQSEEAITLRQISKYLTDNKLYTTPPAAVNQQLLEALEAVLECGSTTDQWWIDKARSAILAAQHEPDTKTLITDSSKWRVDDLVQDVNGDVFTIDGVKGDKLLIKDASENLWLTLAAELTWHSRPTENQNSET